MIGFAREVSIERAEDERESPAPRRTEAVSRRTRRSPGNDAPQPKRRFGAGCEVLIERNNRSDGRGGRGTAGEDDGNAMFGSGDDQIVAVARATLEYSRQEADVVSSAEFFRRGREDNDGRSKTRQPDRRSPVCPLVRIEREISNPSGRGRRRMVPGARR